MVKASSPTIATIRNEASEADARALLYIAICEVCDFFNVGKTMNDIQVAMTIDLIIEQYWHLKIEEIKYCFRRAMRTERLYDRLDGNIILSWIQAYDDERTEEAMRQSDHEAEQACAASAPSPGAVSYAEYVAMLTQKAAQGDKQAQADLDDVRAAESLRRPFAAIGGRKSDLEFREWKIQYLIDNEKKKNEGSRQ